MSDRKTSLLIRDIRDGSKEAFGSLLARYRGRILSWIEFRMDRRLGRRIDPEDILQNVYITAYRKFPETDITSAKRFARWMIKIIENSLRDAVKKHVLRDKRNIEREFDDDSSAVHRQLNAVEGDNPTPSEVYQRRECLNELLEILQELPSFQREVVTRVRIGEQRVAVVARELGVTPDVVSVALMRGIKSLVAKVRARRQALPYLTESSPANNEATEEERHER